MSIIYWIVIGGIAGWLADRIMGSSNGLAVNIAVGIVGAFIGGWIFGQLGIYPEAGIIGSLVTAVVGAVVLIFGIRLVRG